MPSSLLERTSYFPQKPHGSGKKFGRATGVFYVRRLDGIFNFVHVPAKRPSPKHSVDYGRRVGQKRPQPNERLLLSALDSRSVHCLYGRPNTSLGSFSLRLNKSLICSVGGAAPILRTVSVFAITQLLPFVRFVAY